MSNPTPTSPRGQLSAGHAVAALHEAGERWRLVIAQGSPARVVEASTLPSGAVKELGDLLRKHHVERLIRLAPGPQTVARCVSIPEASAAETAGALRLIGEAELPDTIPTHRRASGLIPDVPRAGAGTGLLTGWQVREGVTPIAGRGATESWATEIAALAALRGEGGGGGVAAFADSAGGAISILASGPSRTIARVLVEDNSTPEAWQASVERAIAETCRTAGLDDDCKVLGGRALTLGEGSHAVLAGATGGKSRDPGWLDDYGLALGAAMLALSEQPARRSLTELRADAPRQGTPLAERGIAWLSIRRNAGIGIVAAVAALLLLPLGIVRARQAVLDSKVDALRSQEGSRQELERSAALYAQLQKTRWPMTKLLADVSGALPVGVQVRTVRLSPDQGLVLEATADSRQTLGTLQQNLNKPGVFRDVQISRAETGAGGVVEFEIAAAVASPFMNAPPVEDYAAQPLAVRLYGEGATNTNWNAESEGMGASRPVRAERPERGSDDSGKSDDKQNGDDGPSTPTRPSGGGGSAEVPEALTDEQIKAMDFNTSMKAWSTRKKALSTNKAIDQPTKDRLTAEIDKLKAQMDSEKAKPKP